MLEMKNVTKRFGSFVALEDLTLTVPKGAVYGLVGPNGAGKSTAIRHLTGVYKPDAGSVTCGGQEVYENPGAKAGIGYIPDDIFYYPSATMEDMRKFYKGMYPRFDDGLFERLREVFDLPMTSPIRWANQKLLAEESSTYRMVTPRIKHSRYTPQAGANRVRSFL